MWGNVGDESAGGFMNSPSQFASPSIQGKKDRRHNNLYPITIKAIEDFQGDSLTIGGAEIKMIVIIGIIRTVDVSSTKITYTIDDSTGCIEAYQWLQSDTDEGEESQKPLMEQTYCRAIGTIKHQLGKKHVMLLKIEPLTDLNRLTTHLLEVIHDRVKLEHINTNMAGDNAMAGGFENQSDAFGGGTLDQGNFTSSRPTDGGLSGTNKLVFQLIQLCKEDTGVWRDNIYTALRNKVNAQMVDQALDFLTGEGHIYSTIDDDHFRTTDTF